MDDSDIPLLRPVDITVRTDDDLEGRNGNREHVHADRRHHRRPPLLVKLTGYRLLNIIVILAFGVPKAVASYHGQSVIPTTLDLVMGVVCAVLLYWLGCYETEDLSSLGWLFDTDYASGAVRACTFGTSLARRAVIRGLGAAMRCILRVEDSTDIEPPQVFTARSSAHRPFAMRPKRIILHAPPPEHTAPPALSADTDRPPSPSPPPKRVHFADGSEERPRRARSFSHVKSESQRTRTLNGRVYDTRQLADEERGLGGGNRTVRPVRREDEDEDGGGMAWMRRRRELRERQRREQEEASASRVEEEGGTEQKEHVPVPVR